MEKENFLKEEEVKKIGKSIAEMENIEAVKLTVNFKTGVTVTYSSFDDEDVRRKKFREMEKKLRKR